MRHINLWRTGLILLAAFTLGKSLVWAFVNPPLNVGDESAHLMYIMQLRNNEALPVFKFAPDCSTSENSTPADPAALLYIEQSGYARLAPFTAQPYESYQPPLYYLSAALFALPFANDDVRGALYASRLLSSLLAMLTVVIAAFALRELTLRPCISLAVATLLTSIPVFGFFGGVVSNDNMLNLFAVSTLLVALKLLRSPLSMLVPGSLLLGALTGGALLSKASGIALIPVGMLALSFAVARSLRPADETGGWWPSFVSGLRTAGFWPLLLRSVALYILAFVLVDGWLMLHNLREYGDLLGTANTIQYGAVCWGPTIASQGLAGVPRFLLSLALLTPFSFIATFGWGDESIGATLYYALILPFLLVDVYFGIRWLVRRFRLLPLFQQNSLLVLGSIAFMNLIIWIGFNFTIQYQPVGRYLYMALLPVVGFLALGPLAVPSNPKVRGTLWLFVLVALNLLTLLGWLGAGSGYMATHAHG